MLIIGSREKKLAPLCDLVFVPTRIMPPIDLTGHKPMYGVFEEMLQIKTICFQIRM